MIKIKVWRFYGFSKYSVYFCVFKFRIKILIAGKCNLTKILQVILFFIRLLKQSTRRSKNFLKTSPAITHSPIFTVNFQLMSICFGFPITLTLNQTSLSIFILKSLKPIHRTNKKKRRKKKKKKTFHVARKAKRNKEASVVIVLGGWHVNLSGVGRGMVWQGGIEGTGEGLVENVGGGRASARQGGK